MPNNQARKEAWRIAQEGGVSNPLFQEIIGAYETAKAQNIRQVHYVPATGQPVTLLPCTQGEPINLNEPHQPAPSIGQPVESGDLAQIKNAIRLAYIYYGNSENKTHQQVYAEIEKAHKALNTLDALLKREAQQPVEEPGFCPTCGGDVIVATEKERHCSVKSYRGMALSQG